jgi:hypothetical protein
VKGDTRKINNKNCRNMYKNLELRKGVKNKYIKPYLQPIQEYKCGGKY